MIAFLTVMPLLEDKGWAGVQERFSTHYWHIVTMNWRVCHLSRDV